MSQAGLVVLLVYLLSVMASAQKGSPEDDLKKVTASGTLEKNVYSNEHVGFRLALPEPPCDPKLNTKVDVQRPSAILLECEHVVKGLEGYVHAHSGDRLPCELSLPAESRAVRSELETCR